MPAQLDRKNAESGPSIRTTRWLTPVRDDHWRARGRILADELPEAWATFFGKVPWSTFWTLTFDPKRRGGVGQELANREAFGWANQSARVQRKAVGWVYGTERGKSGLWHIHALTTALPDLVRDYLKLDWELRNGNVHARSVTDTRSAVIYTSKQAALAGEMVFSDTMSEFHDKLTTSPTVGLWSASR